MKYLLLILVPLSLYASKILSYNIYERSDHTDLMITFDTPYSGTIKQSLSQNKIIIKLEDAQIESSKIKKVNSDFLHTLTITPLQYKTQIVAYVTPSVRLIASQTSDAYGLRLRFTKRVATHNMAEQHREDRPDLSALPTQRSEIISTNYYIVVGAMFIAIILLLLLKKKIDPKEAKKPKSSWLFNANGLTNQKMQQSTQPADDANMVTIRFQKAINEANSVVMLDFGTQSYLVLMGNSNILLEKFKDNIPQTQQEFETVLQKRNEELEEFLGTTTPKSVESPHKEPLQAYKERAAFIYNDENFSKDF